MNPFLGGLLTACIYVCSIQFLPKKISGWKRAVVAIVITIAIRLLIQLIIDLVMDGIGR